MYDSNTNNIRMILLIVVIIEMILLFALALMKQNESEKTSLSDDNMTVYSSEKTLKPSNSEEDNGDTSTFKNDVKLIISSAKDLFTEFKYLYSDYESRLAPSDHRYYKGLCFTVNGIIVNGYLDRSMNNYKGIVLLEIYNSEPEGSVVWIHNNKYGYNGLGTHSVNNSQLTSNDGSEEISKGYIGIVTELGGIKKMYEKALNGSPLNIESPYGRSGTGNLYNNISCIDSKIG